VQPFGARNARFTRNVDDCVGTFSVGSWMGIIVALVLVTALLLSWMMLNSVQTMDRFDDPKQKQIVINAKE
jgi:V-type H+-transporting ATPase S1 subunit